MNHSGDPYISKEFAEGRVDRKLRMLEGVARILSDNYNVSVVFSPDGECKTTQEVMTLPYDKGVDEALILGLCGHETGHLKHTDFTMGRVIARHKKVHNRPLLYVIFNALEDVRIEIEMEKVYPGFKEMFARLLPYIKEKKQPILDRERKIKDLHAAGKDLEEITEIIEADCEVEVKKLMKALKEAGFSEKYIQFEIEQLKHMQEAPISEIQKILDVVYLILRHYDYNWYPPETIDFVKKEVLDIAKEVYKCKDSSEVLEVAIKVYSILTDNERKTKKQPKGKEDEDGNNEEKQDKGEGGKDKDEDSKKSKGKGGSQKDNKESESGEGSSEEDKEEQEGKGEDSEDNKEGEEDEEGGSDTIRVKVGQVLKVGSKVTHLHDPTKRGVVLSIDNKTREVIVEWESE